MNQVIVQCVYGASHVDHLQRVFLPALARATTLPVRLHAINYDPSSTHRLTSGQVGSVDVLDVVNPAKDVTGFAENHNRLFQHAFADFFVMINPDCIPQPGSIDALIARKHASATGMTAIVEGRQWPFEHPKEYDPLSLTTPWASGAFLLVDSQFYQQVGGMDPIYFLYLEDVDLSWKAWLNGYEVLYEPLAMTAHFSGGPFYRKDIVSPEEYLSLRNFLILAKKFFGTAGETRAIDLVRRTGPASLGELAIDEYRQQYQSKISHEYPDKRNPNVKILGLNQFHEWRY